MKNSYIVLEGLEGAGKTTAITTVVKTLMDIGINNVICTRDPGGTPIAEKLRELIKHDFSEEEITYKAELLILYAARIQLVENIIRPAIKKGKWVIGDRYELSSQAYQGGGRKLSNKLIKILRYKILNNFKPDLTLYLDVEPKLGLERICNRNFIDRIEGESLDFFNRTRQFYLKLAKIDNTIITIDANQTLKSVQNDIQNVLLNWFKIKGLIK